MIGLVMRETLSLKTDAESVAPFYEAALRSGQPPKARKTAATRKKKKAAP